MFVPSLQLCNFNKCKSRSLEKFCTKCGLVQKWQISGLVLVLTASTRARCTRGLIQALYGVESYEEWLRRESQTQALYESDEMRAKAVPKVTRITIIRPGRGPAAEMNRSHRWM